VEAKRDGFRHWLLYVTRSWEEPITFKGSYPNSNCLDCHAPSPAFQAVQSHRSLADELRADEMACFTCHALPHPARPERSAAGWPEGG
jgi:cytochrome c nitrite reductase small subunit